jgi:hypothetical protein
VRQERQPPWLARQVDEAAPVQQELELLRDGQQLAEPEEALKAPVRPWPQALQPLEATTGA